MQEIKIKIQRYILFVSIILFILKFIAYFITYSMGILTDAVESIVNVVAGGITLYSIYVSSYPKDYDHPFGHGKIEFLSAYIEGVLIIVAGILIIIESIKNILNPTIITKLDFGIIIVAIAGLINYILGWYCIYQGKKYSSIALEAEGKHLQSDTYSSVGLVIGLLIVYFTKIILIDSLVAILFATIIIITGISILKKTISNLMDKIDIGILNDIRKILQKENNKDWIDVHNLKVIKYGSSYFIDCDITLPFYYNIKEGHKSCDILKEILNKNIQKDITLSIHMDPCYESNCYSCIIIDCKYRKHKLIKERDFSISSLINNTK